MPELRPWRIGIGQLWQETNSLNPLATTRADFEAFGVLRGPELVRQMADTNELGAFIQTLAAWPEPTEVVGLVRLPAWPSGPLDSAAQRWLIDEVRLALVAAGPLDGVLWALHGALAAVDLPDVTGRVLALTRQLLGPGVPVVGTLDLHAQVTRRMLSAASALVLFHTVPHVDVFETGQRGAQLLHRLLARGEAPVVTWVRVPAVFPAERANTEHAGSLSAQLKTRLQELECRPGFLAAGLATVQPWLDVPELGSSIVLVSDEARASEAATVARELADELWRRRDEYLPNLVPVAEAVARAWQVARSGRGLVVLSDPADATTSGAPGDSTALWSELAGHDWPGPVLVTLVAPEVVDECRRLGAGATWSGSLGGRRDARFSHPWSGTATIERLFEARFVLSGHLSRNLPIDMGSAVVLRRGELRLIVTSRSGPHFAPALFQTAGFDPFAAAVLVAKSPSGFRAAYESRAAEIISVSAPGCAPSDFWNYAYAHRPRPLWPWERDFAFVPRVEQFRAGTRDLSQPR